MLAESGEFAEISKKIIFQGKEFTQDERFHMKRELGDILWYWVQGCKALGFEPEEVMQENINKLEKDTLTDLKFTEVKTERLVIYDGIHMESRKAKTNARSRGMGKRSSTSTYI